MLERQRCEIGGQALPFERGHGAEPGVSVGIGEQPCGPERVEQGASGPRRCPQPQHLARAVQLVEQVTRAWVEPLEQDGTAGLQPELDRAGAAPEPHESGVEVGPHGVHDATRDGYRWRCATGCG